MALRPTWSGQVEPDYFQFYLRRSSADWAAAKVTDEGRRNRLWSDGQFVCVGTRRKFGTTPVAVDVLPEPPGVPASEWQHVAEVGLGPGGPLEVLSWAVDEPVAIVPVPHGSLRLRVLWKGLVADQFEGLDEEGNSDERIALVLWPSPARAATVIRGWDDWPW